MKKIIAYVLLLTLMTIACAIPSLAPAQSPVIENSPLPTEAIQFTPFPTFTTEAQSPAQPTVQPTLQPTVQPTSLPTLQPTTQPTLQPTVQSIIVPPTIQLTAGFPTFTPPTALSSWPNQIRFAPNGTYIDVTDSISAGVSKTYTLNALKGQIMSISILPQIPDGSWGYIPIKIKGADGSILCPQLANSECMFWRGVLPSSQDYFVTLTPNGNVPQFVMRVAINPPGKDAQYFQYHNSASGISLIYPDTFAPALPVMGNYKSGPELTLHFIDSKTYDKTNLSEVYLFVSSNSSAQVVATCTQPNQNGGGPEQIVGNEVVNGISFVHSTSEGVGAGNIYQQEIYRTVKQNVCYEVIYYLHSSNIGNYPPESKVTEFDRNAIMQKLFGIFSTFTIQ